MEGKEKIEVLLQKPYFVIDFLPEQVPQGSQGSFFEIEEYFLNSKELENVADKFTRIILKLLCYYNADVFTEQWSGGQAKCSQLSALVRDIILSKTGYMNLLFANENTLLCVESGTLAITVYNPNADIQRITSALAHSEGLFWWTGVN